MPLQSLQQQAVLWLCLQLPARLDLLLPRSLSTCCIGCCSSDCCSHRIPFFLRQCQLEHKVENKSGQCGRATARTTPPIPPAAILFKLISAPIGIIIKNVMIGIASAATLRKVVSRFPQMIPIISGIRVAIKDSIGMDAIPAVPIAIIVKNGPSFNDRIEIAPASVSSPYCCARPEI